MPTSDLPRAWPSSRAARTARDCVLLPQNPIVCMAVCILWTTCAVTGIGVWQVLAADGGTDGWSATEVSQVASAASPPEPSGAATEAPSGGQLPGSVAGELGSAAVSEEENPLPDIGRQMLQVGNLLESGDSGPRTQQFQQQIAERLRHLLRQLQQQSQQTAQTSASQQADSQQSEANTNNSQPSVGQAQSTSRNPQGTGGRQVAGEAQSAAIEALLKSFWGELPERLRDRVNQPLAEEFLPKYRAAIEQYYRRLAELREQRP